MAGMRRRDFIAAVGSTAVAWPARAQQAERMRRIGVLASWAEDDPDNRAWTRSASSRNLIGLDGRKDATSASTFALRPSARIDQVEALAKELIALQPDVIMAQTTPVVAALQRESRALPIVFVYVSDPVGFGFVDSLARPGGNLTGLLLYEASIIGKWLAMLREVAPHMTRATLVGNPKTPTYDFFLRSAEKIAPSLGVELVPTPVETAADIERAMICLRARPMAVCSCPRTTPLSCIAISSSGSRPAIACQRSTRSGISSRLEVSCPTVSTRCICRQAASYVDRILRGANPAELPVQAPVRYETAVNLQTARALGLNVPSSLLALADEVIE